MAPIKPDDHSRTNTAGAAKTAASSIDRGIAPGPAASRYGLPSGRSRRGRGQASGGGYAAGARFEVRQTALLEHAHSQSRRHYQASNGAITSRLLPPFPCGPFFRRRPLSGFFRRRLLALFRSVLYRLLGALFGGFLVRSSGLRSGFGKRLVGGWSDARRREGERCSTFTRRTISPPYRMAISL